MCFTAITAGPHSHKPCSCSLLQFEVVAAAAEVVCQLLHHLCMPAGVDGGRTHCQVWVGVKRDRLACMLLRHVLKHLVAAWWAADSTEHNRSCQSAHNTTEDLGRTSPCRGSGDRLEGAGKENTHPWHGTTHSVVNACSNTHQAQRACCIHGCFNFVSPDAGQNAHCLTLPARGRHTDATAPYRCHRPVPCLSRSATLAGPVRLRLCLTCSGLSGCFASLKPTSQKRGTW